MRGDEVDGGEGKRRRMMTMNERGYALECGGG